MNGEFDLAGVSSGRRHDHLGLAFALHQLQVASPFLKRFDQEELGVRKRPVELGRPGSDPDVDHRCG
jgi:hypothetical protein